MVKQLLKCNWRPPGGLVCAICYTFAIYIYIYIYTHQSQNKVLDIRVSVTLFSELSLYKVH
jgi:hypothetical protein